MSTGYHLALRSAMVALFLAGAPLAGGRVKPGRSREAMVNGVNEEVRVWLHDSDVQESQISGATTTWRTQMAVHCKARTAALDADTRADALAQQVLQRVANSGRLGGLVLTVAPARATWEGEALDADVSDSLIVFAITHRTPRGAY